MKIAIASDHAGFEYKRAIIAHLKSFGHQVEDFGTDSNVSCDYPDYIRPAAQAVADGDCDGGIVLGGSGNGEAIVANKVRGIRCGLCWNIESAELTKKHNNANMISIGQRMVSESTALNIVQVWLDTSFEGGRHVGRIAKIEGSISSHFSFSI